MASIDVSYVLQLLQPMEVYNDVNVEVMCHGHGVGGRKNKRVKKSTNSTSSTTSIGNTNGGFSSHMTNQKTLSSSFDQALTQPPYLLPQYNLMNTKDFGIGNGHGMFTTSNHSLIFPFSTSSSFDTTMYSSSIVYNYGGEEGVQRNGGTNH